MEIICFTKANHRFTALNAIRKHRGLEEMDAMDFLTYVREKMALVKMDEALLKAVNKKFGKAFEDAVDTGKYPKLESYAKVKDAS